MGCHFNRIKSQRSSRFKKPIDLVVWASRVYLFHRCQDLPVPDYLDKTFRQSCFVKMYQSLTRAMAILRVSTIDSLSVHEPDCVCISDYEVALINAIRALQHDDYEGYVESMSSIVKPLAVTLLYEDLLIIASTLSDIEFFWEESPEFYHLPSNVVPFRPEKSVAIH